MPEVNLQYTECLRCGHRWLPRRKEVRICPKCKSAYWDKPRKGQDSSLKVEEQRADYRNTDFEDFLGLLNEHGVNYCIVGAYAIGFYAEPRTTKDIDIFVGISDQDAEGLCKALREFGLDDPSITPGLIKTKGKLFRIGAPPNRIEILNAIDGVVSADVLARKVKGKYGRKDAFYIGLDELIKNKRAIKGKDLRKNSSDAVDYANLLKVRPAKDGGKK